MNRANALVWAAFGGALLVLGLGLGGLGPGVAAFGLIAVTGIIALAAAHTPRRERWDVSCRRCSWRATGVESASLGIALIHQHVTIQHPETAAGEVSGWMDAV